MMEQSRMPASPDTDQSTKSDSQSGSGDNTIGKSSMMSDLNHQPIAQVSVGTHSSAMTAIIANDVQTTYIFRPPRDEDEEKAEDIIDTSYLPMAKVEAESPSHSPDESPTIQ